MITRGDAARLVQSWADEAARSDGGEWTALLEEFEHGYLAWIKPPEGAGTGLGESPRRVIDRETGEITTWGSVPDELVADRYRQHRRRFPAGAPTVDPVATIRTLAARSVAPTTAAHLMLEHDRRLRIAYGAKGDQELNHHPVVREWLDALPPGHLGRGAERHAEMIVISDVLHSYDVATGEPTTLEQARRLFRRMVQFDRIRVRRGQVRPVTSLSCYSCMQALVHVGMFLPEVLEYRQVREMAIRALDRPDFPEALRVLVPLTFSTEYVSQRTGEVIRDDVPPRLVTAPPAVQEIARKFNNATHDGSRPGEVHRVDQLWIRPSMRPLQELADDFGRLMSVTAVSIGTENDSDGLVVADERGRVFIVDQAGEWFIGADIDEAMVALFYGQEQRRIRDDGTW